MRKTFAVDRRSTTNSFRGRKRLVKPFQFIGGLHSLLAESTTEVHAAHLLVLNACTLFDQGKTAIKELSMAKTYAGQVDYRAVDQSI